MNVKVIQDSWLRNLSLPPLKGHLCDQSDLPLNVWIQVSWSWLDHCFFVVRFSIAAHFSPVVTELFGLLNFHLIQICVCKMYGFVYIFKCIGIKLSQSNHQKAWDDCVWIAFTSFCAETCLISLLDTINFNFLLHCILFYDNSFCFGFFFSFSEFPWILPLVPFMTS